MGIQSRKLLLVAAAVLLSGFAAIAQTDAPAPSTPFTPAQSSANIHTARITGRVVDPVGVPVANANVELRTEDQPQTQVAQTGEDGQFSFANVTPGPFHLSIGASGFTSQQVSGGVSPDQSLIVPQVSLVLATVATEVRVVPSDVIAEEQLKAEEKQRALGFIPNYYVSYVPDAVALQPHQKFELAWKTMIDPVNFGITGVIAGAEQAQNRFSGYGQGAQGFAKRYGAAYADFTTSTLIGSAILPSVFKQDPRYFYKGTGSSRSRLGYALANSVICKGDNGRWQLNYSAILGSLAAAGISNLYYPAKDRNGASLTFENALIGIGATAAANVLQEFVIKKLTPNAGKGDPNNNGGGAAKPLNTIARAFGKIIRDGD